MSIRKAFILAAGEGTRLRPLTDATPKCLLPIAGEPMLGIWLDLCRQYGVGEITVNLHSHAAQVREWIRAHSNGLAVRCFEEPQLLGSAGTLRANRYWAGDEPFWVFYGDVLTNADLGKMATYHRGHQPPATLGLSEVADPSRCGIAAVDESGLVTAFVEKPKHEMGNLAFSGVLIGTSRLLEKIPESSPVDIGFDVLPQLVGEMRAYRFSELVLDIGTIANYQLAQQTWPAVRGACKQNCSMGRVHGV